MLRSGALTEAHCQKMKTFHVWEMSHVQRNGFGRPRVKFPYFEARLFLAGRILASSLCPDSCELGECGCMLIVVAQLSLWTLPSFQDLKSSMQEKRRPSQGTCFHHYTWVLLQTDSALRRTRYVSETLPLALRKVPTSQTAYSVRTLTDVFSTKMKWLKTPQISVRQATSWNPQ